MRKLHTNAIFLTLHVSRPVWRSPLYWALQRNHARHPHPTPYREFVRRQQHVDEAHQRAEYACALADVDMWSHRCIPKT